ncbi:MAG: amidohydrolase family protein [Bacteroidales bacterium]
MKPLPQFIEGIHYTTGRPVRLTIRNGFVDTMKELTSVMEIGSGPIGDPARKSSGDPARKSIGDPARKPLVIAPGLVDLQVNGFMGIDFNDPDLSVDKVNEASAHLLHNGITGYCPTLITGPADRTSRLLGVIAEAIEKGGLAGQMILGIHVEGPFISREPGPRGAHPEKYCSDPDPELFRRWQEQARGWIRVLTLAPELPGSVEMIRACREMGVIAAIGHTAAGSEEIRRAADAGATLSTHLGNGAHRVLPRHPNYIWDRWRRSGSMPVSLPMAFTCPMRFWKSSWR